MHRLLATGMIFFILFGILFLGGLVATIVMVAVRAGNLKNRAGDGKRSYFDGGAFAYIGLSILVALIDVFSFGFAYPWALCLFQKWEKKHTVINGRRLYFKGQGIEIFGWNILWNFLSVITFGIFSIWRVYYIYKWTVKNTVYDDGFGIAESRFTGGGGAWFVHMLFVYLMTVFSFGFATPWAIKTYIKWQTANTEIGGSPLVFKGTGGQLFGRYMLYILLSFCTFGFFALFIPVFLKDWTCFNTDALYATDAIKNATLSHERSAIRDFASIKIAANQSALELEKSGITSETSDSQIEELASRGNVIAKYRLALIKKGNDESFSGEALDLLKTASDAGYHIAMYEYASLAQTEDEFLMLLDGSARRGNMQAVRKLREFYTERGYDVTLGVSERTKNLSLALYWFKISLELGDQEALKMQQSYNGMLETLSLLLCGEPNNRPSAKVSVATVVWTSILSVIVLLPLIILLGVALIGGIFLMENDAPQPERLESDDYAYVYHGEVELKVNRDNLYRDKSQICTNDEFSPNFDFDFELDDHDAEFSGRLGDYAYVDYDEGVTYIDFGMGNCDWDGGDYCFYLVSDEFNRDEDGTYIPLCGVVRPGESIYKINHILPEGEITISVMMYNGRVDNLLGTSSAVQGGTHIIFNGDEIFRPFWVAQICRKTVTVTRYTEGDLDFGESDESSENSASLENVIVGHWESAVRTDNIIFSTTYTFNSDGTFEMGSCEYMHTSYAPELFYGMPEGWQTVPMGYPYTAGTYTVEGDQIIMTGTVMEAGDELAFNLVLTVSDSNSEFLTVVNESDREQKYYKCNTDTSIEAVCDALGISTAP